MPDHMLDANLGGAVHALPRDRPPSAAPEPDAPEPTDAALDIAAEPLG